MADGYPSDRVREAVSHFEKRRTQLDKERNTWQNKARELAEYILPEYDRYDKLHNYNKGDVSFDSIVDSTATLASEILASGLMSGVTNPARKWIKLSFPHLDLNQDSAVKEWLEDVERIMLEVFTRSNLYNVLPVLYQEIGVFGTGVIYVQEDADDMIRCWNFAPGEYWLATDSDGKVNTLYREFSMTANQLVSQFGEDNVSETAKSLAEKSNGDEALPVVHVIEPIDGSLEIDGQMPFGAKWRSVYYERGTRTRSADQNDNLLQISGYMEFPIMAPRWATVSTDVYGWGRGHKCLGDIKQLQYQTEAKLEAVEKMIKPPLKAPVGTNPNEVSTLPDHISFYNPVDSSGIEAMYQVNLPIQHVMDDIFTLQDRINRYFYVDAFRMLSNMEQHNKTATEVNELREEKLLLMGTVLQRLNDELLDPLIDRVFGILMRRGVLPDPPEEIEGEPIKVEYLSILAQAQKAQGTMAIERFTAFAGNYVAMSQDPAILNKINVNEMADQYASQVGVSPKMINTDEEADALTQQQQQMQQAQQMAEVANTGSAAAQNLSQTPVGESTALENMINGFIGGQGS